MYATVGAVNVLGVPAAWNQAILGIQPRPGLSETRFLTYWLQSLRPRLSALFRSNTQDNLNAEQVAALPFPSRPSQEQRAIADFLDAKTARIDALIANKTKLVVLLEERVRVMSAELACGRPYNATLSYSGHDWLGAIPGHWSVEPLKNVARLESGHTPSRTRPELWTHCTIPWVTLNDLSYLATHEFVHRTTNLISEAGLASSSARLLPAGTVIMSRDATVGRCGILAHPMATSQHFVNWVCFERMSPRYLWLVLTSSMQQHFESLTAGATLKTIGMPDVKALVVPVPPLEEQQRIVEHAEQIRARMNTGVALLRRQIGVITERRQALITAAVTGELV